MNNPLLYSIRFTQTGDNSFTHEDLKRVANLAIEAWGVQGAEKDLNKLKPEVYEKIINDPFYYVELNKSEITKRLLMYTDYIIDGDLVLLFNLNEILNTPAFVKSDYWQDKYIQDYSHDEKIFHPLIEGFFNRIVADMTFIFFKEMTTNKNFKDLHESKHKLFNQSEQIIYSKNIKP